MTGIFYDIIVYVWSIYPTNSAWDHDIIMNDDGA